MLSMGIIAYQVLKFGSLLIASSLVGNVFVISIQNSKLFAEFVLGTVQHHFIMNFVNLHQMWGAHVSETCSSFATVFYLSLDAILS
jgi:hypothetical protein